MCLGGGLHGVGVGVWKGGCIRGVVWGGDVFGRGFAWRGGGGVEGGMHEGCGVGAVMCLGGGLHGVRVGVWKGGCIRGVVCVCVGGGLALMWRFGVLSVARGACVVGMAVTVWGFWHDAMVCCSRLQLAAPTGRSPFAALPLDPFPP